MNAISQYYDRDEHDEWGRLDRHRTELAVTLRALAEYLPPAPAQILDVGGGPGRYAIALISTTAWGKTPRCPARRIICCMWVGN